MFRHAVSQVRSAVRSSYASRDSFAGRFTPTSLRYFSSSTSTYGADISEIQDAKELDALVADSQSNAIIIDFYANWCNPCKILTPRLVKAMEGKTRVKLKKIDVDAFPNVAEALKVSSLPTIMLLHRGKFVEQFQGVITEEDCEKFIQRAAELANINPNENDENSKFREDGGVQSTSDVFDIESIKAKVEVALQGLAEGSSASSATQRAALIAFTNSEDSMRSTPAFLKAEIYSALAMIELNESDASVESVESLVNASEQILAEAKKEGIGAPQVSFSTIAARARLKLKIRANEHNIIFEDHAKCILEYEEGGTKSFELNFRAVLASVVVSDWERACAYALCLLKSKSDVYTKEDSRTLGREICIELIESINFGATSSLAERTRRRLASVLFA